MLNLIRRTAAAALLAAAPAHAQLPDALDLLPPGDDAVLAVPSLDRLDQNSAELFAAIELTTASTLSQTLNVLGLSDALDTAGSAAVAVQSLPPDNPDEGLRTTLILPTASFDAFTRAVGAEPDEHGLHAFAYAQQQFFAKPLTPNYAAVSAFRERLAPLTGERGHAQHHLEMVGPHAADLIERSDLVLLASPDALSPINQMVLTPIRQTILLTGLVDPNVLDPQLRAFDNLVQDLQADALGGVVAARAGALGLRLDLLIHTTPNALAVAPDFRDQPQPDPPALHTLLPDRDFIFTAATRFADPRLRTIIAEARTAFEPDSPPDRVLALLASSHAASLAIYTPTQPVVVAGLLSDVVAVLETPRPDELRQELTSLIRSLEDAGNARGAVAPDQGAIASIPADRWSVTRPADAPNPPLLLTGAEPFVGGRIVSTPSALWVSLAREDDTLAAALSPDQPRLADKPLLQQFATILPPEPTVVWFANLTPVVRQVQPLLAMVAPNLRVPPRLPPVAGALKLRERGAHLTLFGPSPVLRLGSGAVQGIVSGPRPAPPSNRADPQ